MMVSPHAEIVYAVIVTYSLLSAIPSAIGVIANVTVSTPIGKTTGFGIGLKSVPISAVPDKV